ncbi:unnamed protein product [Nippostrongylus brasiliensis]|uniref:FERM domain-containing protein n=1 Tax=Nippostrongylus brasiliensis TaxID=27835 RepID=A0A158R0L5_NIPBR|nr:unnamed protein product [Nippostrongylus brasiliensis]
MGRQVRGSGLESHELLALAAAAAEILPPCPRGTVFDPENVFISSKGTVEKKDFHRTRIFHHFFRLTEFSIAVLRAAGAEEAADVDLFSLVNILTVAMVGTRPTAHRMGLMANSVQKKFDDVGFFFLFPKERSFSPRNQLRGRDAKVCLITIYEEIMGDEETNQLDDVDFSMDEDDDIGALLGAPPNGRLANGNLLPTVTVTTAAQPTVKKAVDYFDEDEEMESRGHSASTSSGRSTQKDTSPFFVDHDMESKKVPDEPRTSTPPSSSSHRHSLGSFGSPIPPTATTRLDETYIEEHSIDLEVSLDRSLDANQATSSKVLPEKAKTNGEVSRTIISPIVSPSESSSKSRLPRWPTSYEDDPAPLPAKRDKARKALPDKTSMIGTSTESDGEGYLAGLEAEFIVHFGFSSSDEDIVQARIDDDDDDEPPIPPKRRSYFDEIVAERDEEPSKSELDTVWKRPNQHDHHRSPMSSPPSTSQTEVFDKLLPDPLYPNPKNRPEPRGTAAESTEDETPIEAAFEDAIRERRRGSVPPIADGILTPPTPPPPPLSAPAAVVRQDSPHFERRNSLVPARISGRQSSRSMRGKRKTRAVPEFYDHSRHPSIRLKAPCAKKKKLTLYRVEQADVEVELLNGQRIEVSCRTDAVTRDIFSLVVQHMNINEHVFFGLSFMKDGEHYFLEDHQRLEKFAPAGWKSAHRNGLRTHFVLYLRFRFYPQVLDFIKTDVTMHELYLQVRHDVIEERIQPRRDAAYELAALALQAEFGNRPPPVIHDYFDNQHYLPQICQRHRDFGAHLHRVFRNKPSGAHGAAPFDPDTGAALWIAIMPRGIAIYEEQGSVREQLAEHLWQDTQTLQFDRKK